MEHLNFHLFDDAFSNKVSLSDDSEVFVAYSGGVDSTVMLHLLANLRLQRSFRLTALHVNHGIHPDSDNWEQRCQNLTQSLGIDFRSIQLDLARKNARVSENTARLARYGWFESQLKNQDYLLTAHNKNDQAETFLLNLMRGTAGNGLASIPPVRKLGQGQVVRPMLSFTRQQIEEYATHHRLNYIHDPSNDDINYDRNFIRHVILPQMQIKWPSVIDQINSTIKALSNTNNLLSEIGKMDIDKWVEKNFSAVSLSSIGERLKIQAFEELSPTRQINMIRFWLRNNAIPEPSRDSLNNFLSTVVHSGAMYGEMNLQGFRLCRYKNHLYIARKVHGMTALSPVVWDMNESLLLPELQMRLVPQRTLGGGISLEKIPDKVIVRFRKGGERIKLHGREHSNSLKKLFQAHSIPPWERNLLPLIYCGDEIVAVVPWIVAEKYQASAEEKGVCISAMLLDK